MITYENGLFLLDGRRYSYAFRLTPWGQPEHLHFGGKIRPGDAAALACKPEPGWGCSVVYQDNCCLDALPLEWSGSGRSDYRESPIEILADGKTVPGEFVYQSHEILAGGVAANCGLPQAMDAKETLAVTLQHPMGLELVLYYTVFDTALVRRVTLTNRSEKTVTVNKLMSFCLDLPGQYEMTSFHGGWNAEMRRHTQAVSGGRVVNVLKTILINKNGNV